MNIAGEFRAGARVMARAPYVPLVVAGLIAVGLGLVLGMQPIAMRLGSEAVQP